jgi:glycosyltransferase involved in cell wall biosynthesis
MTTAFVSVVIPTFRRPALLQRCLRSVLAQTYPRDSYEVIVVDDGASADSEEAVMTLAQQTQRGGGPALHYLATAGQQGPAVARNRGWRHAQGSLIAFTDDDTVPAFDWLAESVRALVPEAVAVHGSIVVPTPEIPTDYERNTKGLENAGFVTANCLVRKSALELIGGFDERFRRAWREDSDLYFSLLERAGRVDAAPMAVVIHPVRPGRWGECLRQHANLMFDALLYKKHPARYREVIGARAPLGYYSTVVAAPTTLFALLLGAPVLALLAVPFWMVPLAFLARRRLAGTSPRMRDRVEILLTTLAIPFVAVYWRLRGALRFRVPFV